MSKQAFESLFLSFPGSDQAATASEWQEHVQNQFRAYANVENLTPRKTKCNQITFLRYLNVPVHCL